MSPAATILVPLIIARCDRLSIRVYRKSMRALVLGKTRSGSRGRRSHGQSSGYQQGSGAHWRTDLNAAVRFAASLVLCAALIACAAIPTAEGEPVSTFDGNSFVVRDVRVLHRSSLIERNKCSRGVRSDRFPWREALAARLAGHRRSGQTLLPGLIDAHAHVLSEGHLRNALRFGVTTQLDMFNQCRIHAGTSHARRCLRGPGRFVFRRAPVTSSGGMGTQFGIPFPTIGGPQEARTFVRARLAEGSDYIKILYEPSVEGLTSISQETWLRSLRPPMPKALAQSSTSLHWKARATLSELAPMVSRIFSAMRSSMRPLPRRSLRAAFL